MHFSRLGATLSLTGRNLENLKRTREECQLESAGQKSPPLLVQADLTREADAKKVVDNTIREFGRLDILVNNAGVLEMGTIENTLLEQYDRVMNINVRSVARSIFKLIKTWFMGEIFQGVKFMLELKPPG